MAKNTGRQEARIPSKSTHPRRQILFSFVLLLVPLLGVSLILIIFVFYKQFHFVFPENGNRDLPTTYLNKSSDAYFTHLGIGKVTLVSSCASTATQFVLTPFMFLFSFVVARELSQPGLDHSDAKGVSRVTDWDDKTQDTFKGLLKGSWQDLLNWIYYEPLWRRKGGSFKPVHVAAFGALVSFALAILIVAGDNWVHLSVSEIQTMQYDDIWPLSNASLSSLSIIGNGNYESEGEGLNYGGSYITIGDCDSLLSAPLEPLASSDGVPCSLNTSNGLWNLAYSIDTFTTLFTGISDRTSAFDLVDPDMITDLIYTGEGTNDQVVTYNDTATGAEHAFYFNMLAPLSGLDFVANTTSMVTQCLPATGACQMRNNSQSGSSDLSIPFNCSRMFSGDLNKFPQDGLEQFRGWDSSFYFMQNGLPNNISVNSQLNPFTFNISAAVNSIDFQDLEDPTSDRLVLDKDVINAGNGRVAFALSCTSTVFDVSYSLVQGDITNFKAAPSDPRKASIIKAPLQVGFGRYSLFEQASLAVLLTANRSVADYMAISISQIGIALASGAFDNADNIQQRLWGDLYLTKVPKAPLWFLVICCLLYAALGLVFATIAFILRRRSEYAIVQEELLPQGDISIRGYLKAIFDRGLELDQASNHSTSN
ncbi:MAG: hypothetical protein M1822_005722 [Bathelium mastoideum]|nr:MAG: hypothetical protein M1822_005722 [Bathelium mastoideum]